MISTSVQKIGSLQAVAKQLNFATASALTKTAKQAQAASISEIRSNFTLRSEWYQPQNKMGVRIKAAKKTELVAEVKTASEFLEKFEDGTDKLPRRKQIAIPTENVRRNKRDIVTRANRPAALRGKRTFLIKTKGGLVLFQRKFKGKRSRIVPLFIMKPRVHTPQKPSFYLPVRTIAKNNFGGNFAAEFKKALETAK